MMIKNKKALKNLKEKLDEHISDIENAYLIMMRKM